jgi:hypothetical protein
MSAPPESIQRLSLELKRLDLLLQREILRLRARYQLSLDEFRGLYISDEQVNALIDQAVGNGSSTRVVDELTRQARELEQAASQAEGDARWTRVVSEFGLSSLERDILLLATAPEIDLKYETIYAYLNNDVTRKWPTFDLALRVFSTTSVERSLARSCLTDDATLFASGLIRIPQAPQGPSSLARSFCVSPSVCNYLLGGAATDPRFANVIQCRNPSLELEALPLSGLERKGLRYRANTITRRALSLLILSGREGSGRLQIAEALSRELGTDLLQVDIEAARGSGEVLHELFGTLVLRQRLQPASIYLARCEALFDTDCNVTPEARLALNFLARGRAPIFLAISPQIESHASRLTTDIWQELVPGARIFFLDFGDPDYDTRLRLWDEALRKADLMVEDTDLEALADRFVLTPRQIDLSVLSAADEQKMLENEAEPRPVSASLFNAARAQSDHSIGSLATRVRAIHSWDELILPCETLQRIIEVAAAIRNRHVVYSDWGFEDKVASGKGLKALFSGASGTGKTMAAGVIARELELDLYKIDLSAIVSKYIGETEKNLDRIFRAAQTSNAMLFFDEADALFGKRSEVKDAHDRYANIEVAYLLQKIEEYEGAVILASNLIRNIDDAFSRRMHYVVEFPLPDEEHRGRLWRGMFPVRAPVDADVDFEFIAKQFPMSGGDIRNVVLDAAFLAVQNGKSVKMRHLMQAIARQMVKHGRIPSPADFKQYHSLIDRTS